MSYILTWKAFRNFTVKLAIQIKTSHAKTNLTQSLYNYS